MTYFARATRMKLRFATAKGDISLEHLWDLPLSAANNKLSLDSIAKDISRTINENKVVESFVTETPQTDTIDILRLNIVKYIIDIKLKERNVQRDLIEKKEREKQLLEILAVKRSEKLANLTEEEIEAELSKIRN